MPTLSKILPSYTKSLDLVFMDTASIYAYRAQETESWVQSYCFDNRPDLPQLVLGVCEQQGVWSLFGNREGLGFPQ